MKKCAFTIVFNGLHHLQHNDFAERMLDMFDYWVVAEGASGNTGSTRWCKRMPEVFHRQGRSIDGTFEYLQDLQHDHPSRMSVISPWNGTPWASKDDMVRSAIGLVPQHLYKEQPLWLFQVDVDEQWSPLHVEATIAKMEDAKANVGVVDCRYYIGPYLELTHTGWPCDWTRVWRWHGQPVRTHEPPAFVGLDTVLLMPEIKFEHFAYYYEDDVRFKALWYGGHEKIYENWKRVNALPKESFPRPVTEFFGPPKKSAPGAQILYIDKEV